MSNITFTDSEYLNRKRITKREEFLNIMDHIIPWQEWMDLIRPFYYTSGKRGRPPIKLEIILRMYLLQCWFNLSDEGVEEAIYDSYAMRHFMKIDFYTESVPDATTLLKFRHLLETNHLAEALFNAIKNGLSANGCMMQGGTIVDATIISAPSSTKNQTNSRDPEMASTKKGNQYYFGMKCHIGTDAGSGLVHTVETTPANVHDIVMSCALIREDDKVFYGDSGYLGVEKREEVQEHPAYPELDFRVNQRPSSLKGLPKWCADWQIQRRQAVIRSCVEHSFYWLKRYFKFTKAIYRGLHKNTQRIYMLFASSNLMLCAKAGRL